MFVADNAIAFRQLFLDTLRNMLSPDQAGAFILVLANSLQDDELRNALAHDLGVNFSAVQDTIRQGRHGITEDDLEVFRAIETIGVDSLSCWQSHDVGNWELVYNPVRGLRPARASAKAVDSIMRPFDDSEFHFNKPFLHPEILWQGGWAAAQWRVLYNKFPFAPYHLIIVPDPSLRLPQYLTADYHAMIWELTGQQQDALPGFGVGYNSLGACASVNQLHFQGFLREKLLPIEQQRWVHNGGAEQYPMNCRAFDSVSDSWALISKYHRNNQPYNLLYRQGTCFVLPRRMQGSGDVLPRVRGAGWIEECGVFNVSDCSEFVSVSPEQLRNCLHSLSVPDR